MKNFENVSKSVIKRYCDTMWSKISKHEKLKCEWCGKEFLPENASKMLNSHHLITRQNLKYRYDLNNAIVLCAYCHEFSPKSVHTSFWFFEEWFSCAKPEQYKWFVDHRKDFNKIEDINYYDIYKTLNGRYKELTGKDFRHFQQTLDEDTQIKVIEEFIYGKSMYSIGKTLNTSKGVIQNVLKRFRVSQKHKTMTLEDKIDWLRKIKISIKNGGINNGMFGKTHNNSKKCRSSCTFPSKKIIQYSLDMVPIREWDSIGDASKELEINRAGISLCCNSKLNKSGGYIWRYKETEVSLNTSDTNRIKEVNYE